MSTAHNKSAAAPSGKKGAKQVKKIIKLIIPAASATPAPPVGPALGQHGVNIGAFVKEFNDTTARIKKGLPTPVVISVYHDRSFSLKIKTPPVPVLIKEELGLSKASSNPNKTKVGMLTLVQVKKIAQQKMEDLNAASIEAAMSMVKGTARSMGIDIESQ